MNLQQFVTTEFGTKLWMWLGRSLPPSAGHTLARIVTGIVSRRRSSSIYRILYDNQAVVRGPDTTPEILHQAVGQLLQHVGMTAYDLMHAVAQGEAAIRAAVTFEDDFWTYTERGQGRRSGRDDLRLPYQRLQPGVSGVVNVRQRALGAGALAAGTGRRLQGDARAACAAESPRYANR